MTDGSSRSTASASSAPISLWRNPSFTRVWWAGLISWIGNGALFIALPVHVYAETRSTLATAMTVIATALPSILIGQVAGVLVDRLEYKRVLVLTNLALTLVTLAFLVAPFVPWWVLALLAFVQSSVGQFLGPAEHALLPTLVPQDRLGAANSLNALNGNLARLIGPALGGLLVSGAGLGAVMMFDAATYLVAALLLLGVVAPARTRAKTSSATGLMREWREGLIVVQGSASLRTVFAATALIGVGEGFISTLMAPFVKVILSGGGRELGLIMSVQAVGGIAGAWLLARFPDRVPPLRLLGWSALLSAGLLVPFFNYALVYPALWPAVALIALAGLPFAVFSAMQMLSLQLGSKPEVRGRVFSACFGLFSLTQIFGMGASGVLGDHLGMLVINMEAAMYLIAGVIVLSASRGCTPAQIKRTPGEA